jgi:hypothetical protein
MEKPLATRTLIAVTTEASRPLLLPLIPLPEQARPSLGPLS